uniref:Uncharacterized protein n=1 Tax=Rheinheimera sp. BAL341 TaxID=1708203 RepID=A0A486XV12_9GAMM
MFPSTKVHLIVSTLAADKSRLSQTKWLFTPFPAAKTP